MKIFSDEEIIQIKKVLIEYIKENKEISDIEDFIEVLKQYTDFYNEQYIAIKKELKDYMFYEDNIIKGKKSINSIILSLGELEENNNVFTKANIIASILSAVGLFFTSIATNSIFFLIIIVYGLLWAYLSRYIGLKKGIDSGYVWGYCLGIIGFIVVCVLPSNNQEQQKSIVNNRYEDLEKLQRLKEAGILTDEEFKVEKQKLLR